MRLSSKTAEQGDPREHESAEVIDLASRSAFPAVVDRKAKTEGLGLAAGVALVFGLGAVTLWSMNAARLAPDETAGPAGQAGPAATPQPVATLASPKPVEPVKPGSAATPRPGPVPAPIYAGNPGAAPILGPASNPYDSPSLVFDNSRFSQGASIAESASIVPATNAPAPASANTNSPAAGSAAAFASRIGGVGGAPAQAVAMMNPTTTVTKGTMIPAVLETAINTDVPGYVRAVVSQDVRSFDGKRVLVPRSSRLIGQYQSGVQQGQRRAYVIWTDLIRPDGATVQLQSPAVGFDGTT